MLQSNGSPTLDLALLAGLAGGGPARRERNQPAALVLIATPASELRNLWGAGMGGFATAEAADNGQLVRTLTHQRPEVLLLDLDLPQLGGLSGVVPLRRLQPTTRILVLAPRPDDREAVVALKSGVRGYCDRAISPLLVSKAVAAVLDGQIWVGRRLIGHLLEELSTLSAARASEGRPTDAYDRLSRLTPRERDILDLLGAGASNKEIARKLGVTERTVKAHLTAVFRKLGISGRVQAAVFAVEHPRSATAADRHPTKVQLTP
jgi:DNA-binding NarL/FixJ family response regulator